MRNKWVMLAVGLFGAVFLALLTLTETQKRLLVVEGRITIASPPERVYETLNEIGNAGLWLPWLQADPQAKLTFSGPALGERATCEWERTPHIGSGRVSISHSVFGSGETQFETFGEIRLGPVYAHQGIQWTLGRVRIKETQSGMSEVELMMFGKRDALARMKANFQDQRVEYRHLIYQGLLNLQSRLEGQKQSEMIHQESMN